MEGQSGQGAEVVAPSLDLFDITTELCRGPGVLVDFFLETLSGVII